MKRLWVLLALFASACAGTITVPPPPPPPPINRSVGAIFSGVPTPEVNLRIDTGQLIPCTFDVSQHTVCFLDENVPAPYGADLLMTTEGFSSIDFRFTLQTFDATHLKQELPAQTFIPLVVARHGIVRANGRAFVDDDGMFSPLGATMMWGPWGWKFDQPRTRQNLACLAGKPGAPAGCPDKPIADYVRVLGSVQGASWGDREIRADWPDYETNLASFIDTAYSDYGLRTEISVIGGGAPDPLTVARMVANVVASRREKVIHCEAANELNLQPDELVAQVVAILKPVCNLTAPYSPTGGDINQQKTLNLATGATMGTGHFDRSTTATNDADWRQVRQVWDVNGFLSIPESQNEPAGPQSSVGVNTSPLQLAMMRATGVVAGAGAFVIHTGAGIRGGGAADIAIGRSANYWQVPNFAVITTTIRQIEMVVPADAVNWQKFNQGWAGNPLSADCFWTDNCDHGVVRMYTASNGPEILAVLLGVKTFVRLTAQAAADYELYDGRTATLVERRHLNAGETWQIAGTSNADTGYVLKGHR